jgi:hypothetical protein
VVFVAESAADVAPTHVAATPMVCEFDLESMSSHPPLQWLAILGSY